MNGADRLCDTLLANGVEVCFANPGTSELHFVAALDRKPEMRCVLGLFEGVVTGAADGYARMSGRPAATLLHTGPGLANGLANLHNARRAKTPIVNVVGDHAAYHLPYDAPLTSDIDALAGTMSSWVHRISGPNDVAPAAAAAYRASLAMPGVATLIFPADAAWSDTEPTRPAPTQVPPLPTVSRETVRAVAHALRGAPRRCGMLLAGQGTIGPALATAGRLSAATGTQLFAEMFIARAERGRGRVPLTRIPYPIDAALATLHDIDVLVLVQAPPPVAFFAYPGKPSRLTREDCHIVTLALPGQDAAGALEALAHELGSLDEAAPVLAAAASMRPEGQPIGPLTDEAVSIIAAQLLPEGAIVCDEALTSARSFYDLTQGGAWHDYLMCSGGAIGIGMPLATGAAIASPNRKVLALQADGSAMYTAQALWTQARERLDVVTVIFANRAYAILQAEMRNVGVVSSGRSAERMLRLDEPVVDWVALANGLGVEAASAETCDGFRSMLDYALARPGPFLIEAVL